MEYHKTAATWNRAARLPTVALLASRRIPLIRSVNLDGGYSLAVLATIDLHCRAFFEPVYPALPVHGLVANRAGRCGRTVGHLKHFVYRAGAGYVLCGIAYIRVETPRSA